MSLLAVFAKNLDWLMEAKRVKNSDIVRVVGKDLTTVSRWRNGHQPPTFEDVEKIAAFLHVPPHAFLVPDYPPELVLKALKIARAAASVGERAEIAPALEIMAGSLLWNGIAGWSVADSAAPRTVADLITHELEAEAPPSSTAVRDKTEPRRHGGRSGS